MIRLLSDEDFPGAVVRGLLRRLPELDLVRVQDVGLMSTPDPDILEWAAANDRIVVSGDRSTLSAHAWARVARGVFMPGAFLLRPNTSVASAIDALELIALTSEHHEWVNRVVYIPL
jgi:hypothetical protein